MNAPYHKSLLLLTIILGPLLSAFSSENSFLTVGKSYSVTYLGSNQEASRNGLPHILTILEKGPEPWYFVNAAGGGSYRLWINFAGVLSFSEMPADFDPTEKPRTLTR